ncbi:MAG: hopanoid C-3 methylase HpnR [Methylococcales bacterium]
MKVLFIHPSPLMFSELYLRLEPLGVERIAQAARLAGHEVRILDLQIFSNQDYFSEIQEFRPDALGISVNYMANVPEVIDLAKKTRELLPKCFVFAGGHSISFIAEEVLEHAQGAIDCILRGEGEPVVPMLLEAFPDNGIQQIPGVTTLDGRGPSPIMMESIDDCLPARDLTRNRHKYFIGELDPCASIEFSRGCPWDCAFCSAWTFYGRSYRRASPARAAEELISIREPNVFIVDDVAFIHAEDGHAIAAELERKRVRKKYYLETRSDVLLRNPEVFARWRKLGLTYMFLGIEALDEKGLDLFRKRITPDKNFEALEVARKLDIMVAINIIADPSWDEQDFERVRKFALAVPEIVHITVNTPYPGTEIWHTESRKLTTLDYRLFDVQHAVLPTKLPLKKFYEELVKTQNILNKKHLGLAAIRDVAWLSLSLLLRGQTNFIRMIWNFSKVYNPERQFADHQQNVRYAMNPPKTRTISKPERQELYIHPGKLTPGGQQKIVLQAGSH